MAGASILPLQLQWVVFIGSTKRGRFAGASCLPGSRQSHVENWCENPIDGPSSWSGTCTVPVCPANCRLPFQLVLRNRNLAACWLACRGQHFIAGFRHTLSYIAD